VLKLNVNGSIVFFDNNPVYPTIRQIVFEVLESFKNNKKVKDISL